MGLIIERRGTTTENLRRAPMQCHTCKLRKDMLFTVDANGRPQCADCARAEGHPVD